MTEDYGPNDWWWLEFHDKDRGDEREASQAGTVIIQGNDLRDALKRAAALHLCPREGDLAKPWLMPFRLHDPVPHEHYRERLLSWETVLKMKAEGSWN